MHLFVLKLENFTPDKIFLHRRCLWCLRQLPGMVYIYYSAAYSDNSFLFTFIIMFKFIFLHLYVFADTAAEARLIVGSGWRRFLAFHSLLLLPLSRIFTNIETNTNTSIETNARKPKEIL